MTHVLTYTLEFTGDELFAVRQALQQRADVWKRTADYLESETNDPNNDGPIEDEEDPKVARAIADDYERALNKVLACPVDEESVR
jgi:hypothetical protein